MASPAQRALPRDARVELLVAAAVIVVAGCAGMLFGWAGPPKMSTSTAWWPFYLDSWPPHLVWTMRVFPSLGALGVAWLMTRRWARGRGSGLDLALLLGSVYLVHFALGTQRHGVVDGLTRTFSRTGLEYWGDVHFAVGDTAGFIRRFPTFDGKLSQHGATHPPGLTLLLNGLYAAGLKKPLQLELACSFFAVATALPLWGAARRLVDEETARLAVPLGVLACSVSAFAILSMDTVTMFFAALALYGLARALDGELAGGVLWGLAFAVTTLCTFAAFMLGLTFLALIVRRLIDRERPRPERLWSALACGPAVFLAFYGVLIFGLGYRPVLVFRSGMHELARSDDLRRSRLRALVGNPIAFLGAMGLPLAGLAARSFAGALRRLRDQSDLPSVTLVLGAFAPAVVCTLLGRPRGEVEHVFLLFVPAVVLASCAAARRWYARSPRWLEVALPIAVAQSILVEVLAETYW